MRESIKSRGKSSDSVLISSAFGGDSTQDYNNSSFVGKSDEE